MKNVKAVIIAGMALMAMAALENELKSTTLAEIVADTKKIIEKEQSDKSKLIRGYSNEESNKDDRANIADYMIPQLRKRFNIQCSHGM